MRKVPPSPHDPFHVDPLQVQWDQKHHIWRNWAILSVLAISSLNSILGALLVLLTYCNCNNMIEHSCKTYLLYIFVGFLLLYFVCGEWSWLLDFNPSRRRGPTVCWEVENKMFSYLVWCIYFCSAPPPPLMLLAHSLPKLWPNAQTEDSHKLLLSSTGTEGLTAAADGRMSTPEP